MGLNVGELYALFSVDTSAALTGLGDVQDTLTTIGNNIVGIGYLWESNITNPLKQAGKDIIKTGLDFDDEMAKVRAKAKIDINTEEGQRAFADLEEEVQRVAKESVYTATVMAGAYDKMAMAGWKWQSMIGGLQPIADLAAASGEGLVGVSDIVTDAMTAFGLTWEKALAEAEGDENQAINMFQGYVEHFADALSSAATSSNTDIHMMGESFKYAASMAGALGYTVDDVAIALGLAANRGIKASQAGTGITRFLTNILKPSEQVGKALAETGISLHNMDTGEMYGFMELMEDMRQKLSLQGIKLDSEELENYQKKLDSYDEQLKQNIINQEEYNKAIEEMNSIFIDSITNTPLEKTQLRLAATIAGVRGLPALLSIITASEEEFNGLTDAIYNSEGATHEMKETMLDTTGGSLKMLLSEIDILKLDIEDLVDQKLRGLIDISREVIENFINLDDETKMTIVNMAGIAAAIGPALVGVGMLIKLLPALGSAFSFVASPLGLITVSLGAFAVSALDTEGKVGKAISDIGKAFGLEGIDLEELDVTELLDGFLGDIGDLADNPAVTGFMEKLGEGFRGALGKLGSLVGDIVGYILSPEGIKAIFKAGVSLAKLLIEGIKSASGGVVSFFANMLDEILISWGVIDEEKAEAYKQGQATAKALLDAVKEAFADQAAVYDVDEGMNSEGFQEMALLALFGARGAGTVSDIANTSEDWVKAMLEAAEKAINDEMADGNAWSVDSWADAMWTQLENAVSGQGEERSVSVERVKEIMEPYLRTLGIRIDALGDDVYEMISKNVAMGGTENEIGLWELILSSIFGIGDSEQTNVEDEAYAAAERVGIAVKKGVEDAEKNVAASLDESGSDSAVAGYTAALKDGVQPAQEAAAEITDAVVKQFLLTMSEENGTEMASAFISSIAIALGDPENLMTSAATDAANSIVMVFESILSPSAGSSIGSAFGQSVVSSIFAAVQGVSAPTQGKGYAGISAYQSAGNGVSAAQLERAVRNGLSGLTVQMDGQKVGNIVTPTVSENIAADAALRG